MKSYTEDNTKQVYQKIRKLIIFIPERKDIEAFVLQSISILLVFNFAIFYFCLIHELIGPIKPFDFH